MINFLVFLISVVSLLIYWCNRRLKYFKDHNVPYLKSVPILGALSDVVIGRKGLFECTEDIYNTPQLKNESFFGLFMFHRPALLINDPELIKQILVKDFNSFTSHHGGSGEHDVIGNDNIFFAKDPLWRNLRKKMSPFFSSGKMKSMFPILDNITNKLIENLENNSLGTASLDIKVKEKMCLLTTDVIASVGFGVDANSLANPNGGFATLSKKLFEFTFKRGFEFTSVFLLPEVAKFFKFKVFTQEGTEFIINSITHVMKEREESKTFRNDLIDTLIEIKNSEAKANDGQSLSMETLIAQAAVFFSAGHETSAGTATFMLYELAKHQDIQKRARDELRQALAKNNGKLTYDIVMHETPYLQQVLIETLRLFPVLPLLDRQCTNPRGYSLKPFSDFLIPNKMPIFVPIYAIQRDEKYFPDPLKFDPERFSPENIDTVPAFTNLPFGAGNRVCLGERFGIMQAKTAVIKILMNYFMEMTAETPKEIKLLKNAFVIQSEVPIVLRLVKDKMAF